MSSLPDLFPFSAHLSHKHSTLDQGLQVDLHVSMKCVVKTIQVQVLVYFTPVWEIIAFYFKEDYILHLHLLI